MSPKDRESFDKIEKALLDNKPINKKANDMIEEQFAIYAYLKSLLDMRQEA